MRKGKGASLIELLLVIVIIASAVFLIANIPSALTLVSRSKHISLANEVASKQIEAKRNISFSNLVNDTTSITDESLSLLPNGTGTIVVEDCGVLICTNGEHIKKITATVFWKDNNKTQTVILNTFIGEGGINQ